MSALAFADPTFESQAAFRRIMRALSAPGTILACGEALAPPAAAGARRRRGAADARRLRDAVVDRAVVSRRRSATISPSTAARRAPPRPTRRPSRWSIFPPTASTSRASRRGRRNIPTARRRSSPRPRRSRRGRACGSPARGSRAKRRSPSRPCRTISSPQWAANRAGFPLGVDLIFVADDAPRRAAALDRDHRGSALMYVAVKGGERAIDNAHACSPTSGAATAASPRSSTRQIDEQLVARRRSGDERRLALRSRARRAGDQAGARRPDRGDLPRCAPIAPPCPASASPSRSTPRRWRFAAASRRCSRTCRAARCSARPSTTPTGCSTSRSQRAPIRRRRRPRRPTPTLADAARRRHHRRRRPDRAERRRPTTARRSPTSPATRPSFPAGRDVRLQTLARGDEGFLLGARLFDPARLRPHPSVRRRDPLRRGRGRDRSSPELGFAVDARRRSPSPNARWSTSSRARRPQPPQFTRGYGLVFGQCERKAMSMALVDRALRAEELGEERHGAGAGRGVRAVPLRQRRRRPASSST